jgi:hypothetical protein
MRTSSHFSAPALCRADCLYLVSLQGSSSFEVQKGLAKTVAWRLDAQACQADVSAEVGQPSGASARLLACVVRTRS